MKPVSLMLTVLSIPMCLTIPALLILLTIRPNLPKKSLGHPKPNERDRIDYIWFYPEKGLTVKDAAIFGPKGSIVRSQRVQETSKDKFIEPQNVWPTDHKGVLVTFQY